MRVEKSQMPFSLQDNARRTAIHLCLECGWRYVGEECPHCQDPESKPACGSSDEGAEEPDDTLCQPAGKFSLVLWIVVVTIGLAGLIWLIGLLG